MIPGGTIERAGDRRLSVEGKTRAGDLGAKLSRRMRMHHEVKIYGKDG